MLTKWSEYTFSYFYLKFDPYMWPWPWPQGPKFCATLHLTMVNIWVILNSLYACRRFVWTSVFSMTIKCEFDLWPRNLVHAHDTASYSGEHSMKFHLNPFIYEGNMLLTKYLYLIILNDLDIVYNNLNFMFNTQSHDNYHLCFNPSIHIFIFLSELWHLCVTLTLPQGPIFCSRHSSSK
jgi:hypothetical protein